jgi:glycosyltransferase involved in cell wall biosynthesis
MSPLVSVVIPCFNAGRMLGPALRSVRDQTYPNLEIIFVDNNSTDGSLKRAREVAAQSPRPFMLLRCAEQGANHARNYGYASVHGEYVQWFDADDLLGPDKIERQVAFLEKEKSADIAYCDWIARRHLAGGRPLDEHFRLTTIEDQLLRVLSQIWYPPHAYLIRRDAADRLQQECGWWPGRRVGTDVEYSAVAALLGLQFRHVASALAVYNVWSESQTSGLSTPYPLRAVSFSEIYRRLAQLAERPEIAPRIKARHRTLLRQDWNIWSLPRSTVELRRASTRRHTLRHLASGRMAELRPREAAVVEALLQSGAEKAIAHLATIVAARVKSLDGDIVFIVETLERLRRLGLLTPAGTIEPASTLASRN